MNAIRRKLRSREGASITFALLIFLVCAMASAAVIMAASATAGRMSDRASTDQRYYAVSSAAGLLRDEFNGWTVTVKSESVASEDEGPSDSSDSSDSESTDSGTPGSGETDPGSLDLDESGSEVTDSETTGVKTVGLADADKNPVDAANHPFLAAASERLVAMLRGMTVSGRTFGLKYGEDSDNALKLNCDIVEHINAGGKQIVYEISNTTDPTITKQQPKYSMCVTFNANVNQSGDTTTIVWKLLNIRKGAYTA